MAEEKKEVEVAEKNEISEKKSLNATLNYYSGENNIVDLTYEELERGRYVDPFPIFDEFSCGMRNRSVKEYTRSYVRDKRWEFDTETESMKFIKDLVKEMTNKGYEVKCSRIRILKEPLEV